jgi:putative endonuclease
MSSTDTGRKAEKAASVYLEMRGYKVLERNWRRPDAEIDIIAKKDNVIYFVEVKYRRNDDQGGGLEAITSSKLKHMQRAAQGWVEETKWTGQYQLSAVEIAGTNYAVMSFIDNVY